MRIVILEDNIDRQLAMRQVIADRFSGHILEFFVAAQPMIDHLSVTGLYDVSLISLDNDLELIEKGGCLVNPGDGIEVARWIRSQPAVTPVVVHTTNMPAGDQIMELLSEAGFIRERIVPYDGEVWISERWRTSVRDLIVSTEPHRTMSSNGVQILRASHHAEDSPEKTLREILRATSLELSGSVDPSELCLELLRLRTDGLLESVTGTGLPVLRELGAGATIEIVTESADSFGTGPFSVNKRHLSDEFYSHLKWLGITQVQLDVVQPSVSRQAILFIAVRQSSMDLASHRNQFAIREARSLLEVAFRQFSRRNETPSAVHLD